MGQRGRPPHPDVLTPRQQEVLELVREGLTNDEIARHLGISPDGVKFHVSEILGRLGVGSRREAAGWRRDGEPARPSASLRAVHRLRHHHPRCAARRRVLRRAA